MQKQFRREDRQTHNVSYQTCLPINAWSRLHYDQWCLLCSLQQMHVLVTNSKHCGSDWLLRKPLTFMFWTVAIVPTRACHNVCSYTSISHCYNFYAQGSVTVGSVDVQPGFFLTDSSDSNLGEVYIMGFLKVCSLLWYKI